MELEEEIHQKEFLTEWHKLSVNLTFTYNWSRDKLNVFFNEAGVTTQQFNVLRILRGQYPKPVSTAFIRERMLDRMSDVSRIVDRLEKSQFVEKRACESDKRLVDVVISNEGLVLLEKIDDKMDQIDDIYLNLSEGEAKQLNWLLDKLRGLESQD